MIPGQETEPISSLTNDDVRRVLDAGQLEAVEVGKPFAICLLDGGGHVLGALRDVGAAVASAHSAESKARTAVFLHADTGAVPPTSPIVAALTSGLPYPVNIFPGGIVLRVDGEVVGAVGAAGSTDSAEDLRVAQAAAAVLASA